MSSTSVDFIVVRATHDLLEEIKLDLASYPWDDKEECLKNKQIVAEYLDFRYWLGQKKIAQNG